MRKRIVREQIERFQLQGLEKLKPFQLSGVIESFLHREEYAENENIYEIMQMLGQKRGAIVSGGRVDDEKISNIIIEDYRSGKLGKITLEKVKDGYNG